MMELEAALAKAFDVGLLDEVIIAVYDPVSPNRSDANKLLMQLQEAPDFWRRADEIIEKSSNPQTRFFGLQVLHDAVRTRWRGIQTGEREAIKNFVVGKLISTSSDESLQQQDKLLTSKLNLILVEILRHEWPHNWPTFIADLVGSSKTSENLCENNMKILGLLSEEIFDFGKEKMVTEKAKAMKESLNNEFQAIYDLCGFVLGNSRRPSLLKATLQTLQRYLTWIPLGYIFQIRLLDVLVNTYFPQQLFRNDTLACLAEVGNLKDSSYDDTFPKLFSAFLDQQAAVFSPETNIANAFENGSEEDEVFVRQLALFLSGFFNAHLKLMETHESQQSLKTGLLYLLRISEVRDNEIFRICLDTWHMLAHDLYQREHHAVHHTLHLGDPQSMRDFYAPVLSGVRQVVIDSMVKPEEVLIVEDENGDIVRETTKDTDVLAQYKIMRETLVYLTHLDREDTESIMMQKLNSILDGSRWSWNNLNTLCWAIGSISGAMEEEDEKRFIVTAIRALLELTERKKGKDNKAVCASNIMYIVGQYPRFLKAHWKFLKTVVNKLFEFMHEVHPGVQDMACDTFLKIAKKCKRKFVTHQADEDAPFIFELVDTLPKVVCDLEPGQVQAFYEAVGCMLSDSGIKLDRAALLERLMDMPNRSWRTIMDRANQNVGSLVYPPAIKEIIKILKCNNRVCGSVGSLFTNQLQTVLLDMLNVYKVYSERISEAVAHQGEHATRLSLVRSMRSAKKEVIRLLITFIDKSGPPEAAPASIAHGFIPPLLDPILGDYQRNIPGARDPEVLKLFATVIEKLKSFVLNVVPKIMEAVFECTLQMITTNFEDFPEHRIRFFEFLKAINSHTFPALFNIPPAHQKLVVDSVVWAMKHTERNIADAGLDILHDLLVNVSMTPHVAQDFYRQFLLPLMQDVFSVMTDRLHKSGFRMHATLLRMMFHLVQTNQVTVPLFDPATQPAGQTNPAFLRDHMSNLLLTSFPNLTRNQVIKFVEGMFDVKMDVFTFKVHMRDFLIQLKEFNVDDDDDGSAGLFGEEAEREARQREEALLRQRQVVPGLLKPDEVVDDDL